MKSDLITIFRVIIACFTGLLMLSCANVYQQHENIPVDKLAVLLHPNPERSLFIIEQIDNKWRGLGLIERYELLPGEHVLTCAFQKPGIANSRTRISFTAEAGKKYRAEIRISGDDWAVVVLDDAKRKIISRSF